jgi:tetratricopeptide (TPR) repeat protein
LDKSIGLRFDNHYQEASALHERAIARAELKKYDGALSDIDRALVLEPRSPKYKYLRARVFLYQGKSDDARRDAQDVLRLIPDHNGALKFIDQLDQSARINNRLHTIMAVGN